jgi:glutaredoxin
MVNKTVVVYTMEGCPHCVDFKKMLKENNIDFVNRDIYEHEEEYEIFSQVVENDYVPAVLVIEEGGDKYNSFLYAPDRDYEELTEALAIIKKHLLV